MTFAPHLTRLDKSATEKQESGTQGFSVIPIDEIRNVKVVAETALARFVLQDREIAYDRSGFNIQATSGDAVKR
jgi:hypothetical protein